MTRAEASRIKGAKSKGPATQEGKKRSSRNALKHGLASPFILLPQECPDHFQRLCGDYTRHFQPQNEVERNLVYEAVGATKSTGSSSIPTTSRYESLLMRARDRALEQLRKLRAEPQPDEPQDGEPDENLPNEPEPAPEPGIEKTPNEPEKSPEINAEPIKTGPPSRDTLISHVASDAPSFGGERLA